MAQDCIITEEDCGTSESIEIDAVVDGGDIIVSLEQRLLGRTTAEEVKEPSTGEVICGPDTYVDEDLATAIDAAGVISVRARSPLTCETRIGVCATCYGRDLARGTRVNIGEAVGVIAAQSIGEPGTQLTMRTFHIGGTAQVSEQSFVEATNEGKIAFNNPSTVTNAEGDLLVMSRNMQVAIVDADGKEREVHKLGYGTKLKVKEGDKAERGQRLAEWDPYTAPIVSEVGGKVRFVDITDGVSVKDETDEATGISSKVIIDWRTGAKATSVQPALVIQDENGEPIKLASGSTASYMLAVGTILSFNDGDDVRPGDVIARIPTEGAKTRDITGGLPRVAELFEARRPKDHAVIAEITGRVEFGRDYKNKRRIAIVPEENPEEGRVEYLVPKGKHLAVQENDIIQKGEYLLDGHPAPHDILAILGVPALANYLIDEIQEVYRLQGVPINDKHIETIVRQMLQKIEVRDPGDTSYLAAEQVDKIEFLETNEKLEAEGKRPATGDPVLLGITKASLQTRSFISAASFQETTRVLTEAAVQGKEDTLEGLKENVIVGRLIPAGTGSMMRQYQKLADDRDADMIAEREDAVEAEGLPAEIAEAAEAEAAAESSAS